MRYTPTLKLSTRLATFVTMIVISAMSILFIGGTLSFKRIGQEYMNHYLNGIVEVVDKELEDPDAAYSMQRWLPKMLQASNVVELQLNSEVGVVYRFKNTAIRVEEGRTHDHLYPLPRNDGYSLRIVSAPPYLSYSYSIGALWSITLAVGLIIFCLVRGLNWLREQMLGSEMLEERGRMILAGRVEEFAKGDEREWPYTASDALTVLIEELQDARQERSRFDTFIRSQTFLDQLTGTANRVLFDNKLESALHESGSHGGVMLVRIDDWQLVLEENDKADSDQFIVEVGKLLSNAVQRFPDVILSRYYKADFAIFIPHQSSKDVANVATQCLKQLDKLNPITPLPEDNWCHIGISMYREGEKLNHIIDEAETALKSAQLQHLNTWSRFEKQELAQNDRGSVRWRTVFDQALQPEKLLLYKQECRLISDKDDSSTLHYEVFARIQDPERGELKASQYMAALETVGYQVQLDQSVLQVLFGYLKNSSDNTNYSVNLNVLPFKNKWYSRWLRDELLQLPRHVRQQLGFEFVEGHLVQHLDYMRPVIKMLSGLGIKIIVNQAGRTIVSTHYIKDLSVDYLKLHRSLVKRIDQRPENQLFIRSMLGACSDLPTSVIAVGIENSKEWKVLLSLGIQGGQGRRFDQETQFLPPIVKKPEPFKSNVKVGRRNRWRK